MRILGLSLKKIEWDRTPQLNKLIVRRKSELKIKKSQTENIIKLTVYTKN